MLTIIKLNNTYIYIWNKVGFLVNKIKWLGLKYNQLYKMLKHSNI